MGTNPVSKVHTGRKLVDIAKKARGRTPVKYELEVIPFFAGELPSGLEKASFAWERGAKVFQTNAESVNPHTKAVFWKQYLKQTATIYKDNGRLLPKEYSFKVLHVRGSDSAAVRKTIGKIKVDMCQFCSEDTISKPQEVFLQLKPAGKLKVSIKCTWLKDAKIDMDALTEASFTTHKSTEGCEETADGSEQDLTGFDYAEGIEEHPSQPHQGAATSLSSKGTARQATSSGGGSTTSSNSAAARIAAKYGHNDAINGSSQAHSSPRIAAGGLAHKTAIPGAIPAFSVGLSPAEEQAALQQKMASQAAFKQAEMDKMRRTIEDQLRHELHGALAEHSRKSWRDIFCCCFPGKQVSRRAITELAVRDESESTLLQQQGDYL